ncbi:hypothetical protein EYF80_002737 [Liparis tanakae]|uniref:Uncharacterized protein n=1 Tax=Liparis tanakae TaxID=230148 RepID=A0A4Z2JCE9_9TELE|nr:hypothetical protein EYF80_002737 [Liparis tanakae]
MKVDQQSQDIQTADNRQRERPDNRQTTEKQSTTDRQRTGNRQIVDNRQRPDNRQSPYNRQTEGTFHTDRLRTEPHSAALRVQFSILFAEQWIVTPQTSSAHPEAACFSRISREPTPERTQQPSVNFYGV